MIEFTEYIISHTMQKLGYSKFFKKFQGIVILYPSYTLWDCMDHIKIHCVILFYINKIVSRKNYVNNVRKNFFCFN